MKILFLIRSIFDWSDSFYFVCELERNIRRKSTIVKKRGASRNKPKYDSKSIMKCP